MKLTNPMKLYLSLLICSLPLTPLQSAERPNILIIFSDDLGYADLGCQGSADVKTPHIDSLVANGVRCTAGYVTAPQCSPSRAGLVSGRCQQRFGHEDNGNKPVMLMEGGKTIGDQFKQELVMEASPEQKALEANSVTRLDTSYPSIAKCFKKAGYVTGHIGKWHMGREPYSPLEHGFDEDIPHSNLPSPTGGGWFAPWTVWRKAGNPGDHLEERMAEEVAGFIRRHAAEPFYLQYWMWSVHGPYDAREELIDKYAKLAVPESKQRHPLYAAMVATLNALLDDWLKRSDAVVPIANPNYR